MVGIIVVLVNMGGQTTTPVVVENQNATTTTTSSTETLVTTSTTQETTSSSTVTTPKTYTLANVAEHKDATSCWSVVNGVVYDLTSWIANHPGGKKAILSICGKDGTQAFSGKHGGQERPETTLASFKIGTLAQ